MSNCWAFNWLINWISSVYSHKHVEYSNTDFYFIIVSMLTILQCQLSLLSWACQLFSNDSLSSHVQFSWFNFYWLKFSHSFLYYFFVQLISFLCLRFWSDLLSQTIILSCIMFLLKDFSFALFFIVFCFLVWDFNQVYLYKLLSDFVQHFWKDFLFAFMNIWFHAAFSEKIFCLHLQIFNSEMQISLAFVYNMWKWISQISLAEIW